MLIVIISFATFAALTATASIELANEWLHQRRLVSRVTAHTPARR